MYRKNLFSRGHATLLPTIRSVGRSQSCFSTFSAPAYPSATNAAVYSVNGLVHNRTINSQTYNVSYHVCILYCFCFPLCQSQTSQDPLEHVLASDLSGPPSPAPAPSASQTSNLSRDASMLSVSNVANNTNTTVPLYANLHPDTQVI